MIPSRPQRAPVPHGGQPGSRGRPLAAGGIPRSDAKPAGNARAVWAALLSILSVVTMPLAIIGTRYASSYRLLDAGYAIPVGLVLGVAALLLARGARRGDERALGRLGGVRAARSARILAGLGICLALTALLSVGVYHLLEYLANRD